MLIVSFTFIMLLAFYVDTNLYMYERRPIRNSVKWAILYISESNSLCLKELYIRFWILYGSVLQPLVVLVEEYEWIECVLFYACIYIFNVYAKLKCVLRVFRVGNVSKNPEGDCIACFYLVCPVIQITISNNLFCQNWCSILYCLF